MPSRAIPLSFGPAQRRCFGWLHLPPDDVSVRNVGLVLCNPFGNEAICANRSLRHFAIAAAIAGVPALRFDYDGTGNSAGDDRDPGRWNAWLGSVHSALDEMRRSGQVERLCLLGVRLGATLAAQAASERDDVSGLIAIAPVISGKSWLRELRAMQIAMGQTEPPDGATVVPGDDESVGFLITVETKAALQTVDLLGMQRRPAREVLVIDRAELARDTRWVERLRALDANVEHQQRRGYIEMMLDPHDSVVPEEMVGATTEWLQLLGSSNNGKRANAHASWEIPREPIRVAPGVEETATFLDSDGTLFGIVSAPPGRAHSKTAIVLLNAGAVPNVGPHRLYVQLARRWAARGHVVLRFDLSGVGDSPTRPGETENVVYSSCAVRDIEAALQYLQKSWGVTTIQATGMCSGAYHALKAAAKGLPLSAAAIINPLVYFWKPGMSLAYPSSQVLETMTRYEESAQHIGKWKKVLSGKVSVSEFTQVIARTIALKIGARMRDLARSAGLALSNDLGTELDRVAGRGVALRFIFSAGDPGEGLLRVQGGSSLRRLLQDERVSIRQINGPNHTFTPLWSHDALASVLEDELGLAMSRRAQDAGRSTAPLQHSLAVSGERRSSIHPLAM